MANEGRHIPRGLFAGLMIASVGLVLLLDQQGVVSAEYMFRFLWPAIVIFFGVDAAMCRTSPMRRNLGFVVIGFGVLMLLSQLGLLHVHIGFELLWPLAFIWFGVWIILRSFGHAGEPGGPFNFMGWNMRINQISNGPSNDSQFDHLSIFGGVKRRIVSKNFRGGNLMALMGGFQIDLTKAEIEGDEAVITASCCMGGGEIRIPDTWVLDLQGVPLLGGFVDETHQIAPPSGTTPKRLVIKGIALMGGIVVKN